MNRMMTRTAIGAALLAMLSACGNMGSDGSVAGMLGTARLTGQSLGALVAGALDNMKKNGMQVTQLPPAEVSKLRDMMPWIKANKLVDQSKN